MTTPWKHYKKTLSGAKKGFFSKTPMGESALFGDMHNSCIYSNSKDENHILPRDKLSGSSSPSDYSLDYPPDHSALVDEQHRIYQQICSENWDRASTAAPFTFESNREAKSNSYLRTCNICIEERQSSEFPTTRITPTCTHPVTDTCKECIRHHLASQLSSRGTANLKCICNQPLLLDDVQRNADPKDFARYSEIATMELLESDSQFVWCPAEGCQGVQIHEYGIEEPKVTCAKCGQPYCFTHRVRWHTGMTCREYGQSPEFADAIRASENGESQYLSDQQQRAHEVAAREKRERDAQERENESFVRRNATPCPKCKYMTQKDGGCKHMNCKSRD
ncbi:hypothetical protein MMC07_003889 [Pseudocyphellaria aurata]|nr:hypothetical protein [Pseudocyphellaria aurata]